MAKFTWDRWNFDCDGEAFVIRKDLCPNREDVPAFIVREDNLHHDCMQGHNRWRHTRGMVQVAGADGLGERRR